MIKVLLIYLLSLIAICCHCTTQLTGGSSQQGNGMVVGSIISTSGSPAGIIQIRIRPIDYVLTPGSTVDERNYNATTDSTGRFSISGIYPGNYTIEANDLVSSAVHLNITVNEQNDSNNVGTVGLKPYSVITGVVNDTIIDSHSGIYIQVQGLERFVRVGQDNTFTINDLPEGNFNLHLITADSSTTLTQQDNIKAVSGDTTSLIIAAGWRYSHRLYLNTTTSGADVVGDVVNFPVLVRLSAANFDFSQAKKDGSDISFTSHKNTFLPYEIERWDAIKRVAEIWVNVDTVHGGDSTQFLNMYWGSNNSIDSSNSAAVFDTAAGFAGVWHLNENGDSINDATGNAFEGRNSGSTTETGIIGGSRKFSNYSSIKISGLLNSPSDITLSAWVKSDTSMGAGQDIISLGDAVLIRLDNVNGLGATGCYYTDSVSYTMISSGQYLAKTGWHHLALSINNTTHVQTFYIDGAQCAVTYNVNKISYTGLGTDTYIGTHGNGKNAFYFNGMIDEVRVSNRAMASDWIKLCFMNEKAQDALVQW
jgi:hypothetical protein